MRRFGLLALRAASVKSGQVRSRSGDPSRWVTRYSTGGQLLTRTSETEVLVEGTRPSCARLGELAIELYSEVDTEMRLETRKRRPEPKTRDGKAKERDVVECGEVQELNPFPSSPSDVFNRNGASSFAGPTTGPDCSLRAESQVRSTTEGLLPRARGRLLIRARCRCSRSDRGLEIHRRRERILR